MDRSALRCQEWSHGNVRAADCRQSRRECKDQVRIYVLTLRLILCCIILMIATHSPACSGGMTPLKFAIDENERPVVALLRSVGAEE